MNRTALPTASAISSGPPGADERRQEDDQHDREQVLDREPADRHDAVVALGLARSDRIRPAMAVELMDVNAPRNSASRLDHPSPMPISQPMAIEATTWAVPPTATSLPTRRISWNEMEIPIENIRKMTPRSASELTISMSATRPGVLGPMARPGDDVPDDRGLAKPDRHGAADGRRDQGRRQGDEEIRSLHHAVLPCRSRRTRGYEGLPQPVRRADQ